MRSPDTILPALAILLVALLSAPPSVAQLSPGPLSRAHASLEGMSRCTSCHAWGKGVEPGKCLTCHTPIRERIEARIGLHGRNQWDDCVACHSDHHGEDFELVHWNGGGPDAFDHGEAGFPLRGKHADLSCRQCHNPSNLTDSARLRDQGTNPDRTYLGLGRECTSCHEDRHRPTLGACAGCHDERSWKPTVGFDHDRTRYPLEGRHVRIDCARCHAQAPTSFGPLAFSQCSDCHRDPHRGDLGADCARCHSAAGWSEVRVAGFDHGRTRFPLRGRHGAVECRTCHASGRPVTGRLACFQCHVDPHEGRFPSSAESRSACERCHSEERFVPAAYGIDEHASTRYPLTGSHLAVPCTSCHRASGGAQVYRWADLDCDGCHADPHAGTYRAAAPPVSPCGSCHLTDSWSGVRFAHDNVDFPLEGKHRAILCIACHAGANPGPLTPRTGDGRRPARALADAPTDGSGSSSGSGSAGAAQGSRSPAQPGTGTALPGSDDRNGSIRFTGSPTSCADCHRDPHGAQFDPPSAIVPGGEPIPRPSPALDRAGGTAPTDGGPIAGAGADCSRCHGVTSWAAERFDHQRDSRYRLEGAHLRVPCASCHRVGPDGIRVFRPLGTECVSCHATQPKEAP